MKMTEQEQKAKRTLRRCSIKQLAALWAETNKNTYEKEVFTVRGWIMEVLEAKNPVAFDKWIEGDSDDLLKYFAA